MPSAKMTSTVDDLLVRARELDQLASLVSYGADKARLRERAGQLRREAEKISAEPRTFVDSGS